MFAIFLLETPFETRIPFMFDDIIENFPLPPLPFNPPRIPFTLLEILSLATVATLRKRGTVVEQGAWRGSSEYGGTASSSGAWRLDVGAVYIDVEFCR